MMKVLLIAPKYFPIYNKGRKGAIEMLERLYLEYNEGKQDVFTVYSPKVSSNDYDNYKLKNTSFRIVDKTSYGYLIKNIYRGIIKRLGLSYDNEAYIRLVAKDIIRRNEQNYYDLIIFENGEQAVPVFKRMTKTKTKIVLHLHNDYVNKDVAGSRDILDSCNEVWAVSKFVATRVKEVADIKTIVIPNTIRRNTKRPDPKEVEKIKNDYRLYGKTAFLYVGRLLEVKGIIPLLDAFTVYNRYNMNSVLIMIGETGKNRRGKKMRKTIDAYLKNNENIHLTGYLPQEQIVNYQAACDCQIVPSVWNEAFGLVILEAMAANIPIIASRVGAIPEIGENLIKYAEAGNAKSLVEQMSTIRCGERETAGDYYRRVLRKYEQERYLNTYYRSIHGKR